MKKDLSNVIVRDILTADEVNDILDMINKSGTPTFMEELSCSSYHITLSKSIIDKFIKIAQDIAGEPVELKEYNVSRYSNVNYNGKMYYPMLYPHIDEGFKEKDARITLDYQLRGNVDWSIIIDNWQEEKEFMLKDNELLSFSGTHQVHWRNKKIFKDGDFLDLIFFHFSPVPKQPLSKLHINETRDRGLYRYHQWKLQDGPNQNVGNDQTDLFKYKKWKEEQ